MGLHVNLTEGRPLSAAGSVPTLIGADGRLLGKRGFWAAVDCGALQPDEAVLEVRAQLEWFRGAVGVPPGHVDGHQHCILAPPLLRPVAAELARWGVRHARAPLESRPGSMLPACACPTCERVDGAAARAARAAYAAAGIGTADAFVGLAFAPRGWAWRRSRRRCAGGSPRGRRAWR